MVLPQTNPSSNYSKTLFQSADGEKFFVYRILIEMCVLLADDGAVQCLFARLGCHVHFRGDPDAFDLLQFFYIHVLVSFLLVHPTHPADDNVIILADEKNRLGISRFFDFFL